jgi:hypothetical protein
MTMAALAAVGCGDGDELSAAQATERLRESRMYPRASLLHLPESVGADELAHNPVLKIRLSKLAERGLIRMTATNSNQREIMEIDLTGAGMAHQVPSAEGGAAGSMTVRTATEVMERIISVGPLRTTQGAKVRDVQIAWHYETITPFGEAVGITAGESKQTSAAAVRFGDAWRFIDR